MIKHPSGMAIASVKLSPNRKELRNILIILGEDAEGISFWDVERDRGTIERKDTLQGRADSTQQLILTQFRNDRVVYFKKNAEALLRRPCRTRIARNGGRLPGLLPMSVAGLRRQSSFPVFGGPGRLSRRFVTFISIAYQTGYRE